LFVIDFKSEWGDVETKEDEEDCEKPGLGSASIMANVI
jgi:hypothetical protein